MQSPRATERYYFYTNGEGPVGDRRFNTRTQLIHTSHIFMLSQHWGASVKKGSSSLLPFPPRHPPMLVPHGTARRWRTSSPGLEMRSDRHNDGYPGRQRQRLHVMCGVGWVSQGDHAAAPG